ncbi:hypothetical protein [Aurantiacibacter rhizosphaerae]|uniref:Uncharacterized protein n=1 Tax=Aurantiacibacter rhizosphaerae TaxID=2691582 RepID=A0A844XC56_9SPHN|nr:hypothetical protein [Aurantiacibacter rhizosphaerae]MWV27292.1 hypothetical protein [Aurantiacibacter rhizosphaerae]
MAGEKGKDDDGWIVQEERQGGAGRFICTKNTRLKVMMTDTQDDAPGSASGDGEAARIDPLQQPLSSEELAGDTVNPGKDGGDEFPDGREDFDEPGRGPSEAPAQPVPELPNLPPD